MKANKFGSIRPAKTEESVSIYFYVYICFMYIQKVYTDGGQTFFLVRLFKNKTRWKKGTQKRTLKRSRRARIFFVRLCTRKYFGLSCGTPIENGSFRFVSDELIEEKFLLFTSNTFFGGKKHRNTRRVQLSIKWIWKNYFR